MPAPMTYTASQKEPGRNSDLTLSPVWRGFLTLYLPLCALLLGVGLVHFHTNRASEDTSLEASESINVWLARRMIQTEIAAVISDLMFLAEHLQRQELFSLEPEQRRGRIALEFEVFARHKRLYDQIRLLDTVGREDVRINLSEGSALQVPNRRLQDKSARYYFQEAVALGPGGIYISPLDLNVEERRIERPLKPAMRFATPVFDVRGEKQGVLVLNYLGERLINNFVSAAANIADHIQLVDGSGYWLRSPNPADDWGQILGSGANFGRRYPQAWARISAGNAGQFRTAEGLFTFATLDPHQAALGRQRDDSAASGSGRWKIIAVVSAAELAARLPSFLRQHGSLYAAMFGLITLGAWLLNHYRLRHRQAEAQSEYERRFRRILEDIELAAVTLDRDGRVSFCNDHLLLLTGWRRDQVVGRDWVRTFTPTAQRPALQAALRELDSPGGFPKRMEIPVLTSNGGERLIAWNSTWSRDPKGRVLSITGIGADITEERRAEAELRKLSRAVEQSPSIVLITDRRGLIEYANPKFSEITGYTLDEVIGRNPRILKSGATTLEDYGRLWETLARGGEWRGEFHNRKKNGELYWESASISAIRNRHGEITHFVAVKEDITERKRLETEVAARNRDLAKAQTLAALGRMASMVAHDLRNPLSSVKMTLQILSKQTPAAAPDQSNELRQIALEQIRYMEEILSDMLTYSRPDALKPEWISIPKVLEAAIGITQRKLDEHRVSCQIQFHPGLPTLYGDATKLRQVFSNLIANAAQATQGVEQPRVNIETRVHLGLDGTSIRVEICDNGCGINPAEADKLFEPFYTTRAKGTGLGLAIVRRILDQHRASIEIRPFPEGGTCVAVILPTTPPQRKPERA
jgi:PAS domain S-box-containing protein